MNSQRTCREMPAVTTANAENRLNYYELLWPPTTADMRRRRRRRRRRRLFTLLCRCLRLFDRFTLGPQPIDKLSTSQALLHNHKNETESMDRTVK